MMIIMITKIADKQSILDRATFEIYNADMRKNENFPRRYFWDFLNFCNLRVLNFRNYAWFVTFINLFVHSNDHIL
jgi:hypothetical protein